MPTVRNYARNAAGEAAGLTSVTIVLSDSSGNQVTGYTSDGSVVSKWTTRTEADGYWEVDLAANSTLTPANTVYRVDEVSPGNVSRRHLIEVGTGGPYDLIDILIAPDSLPEPSLGGIPYGGEDGESPVSDGAGGVTWNYIAAPVNGFANGTDAVDINVLLASLDEGSKVRFDVAKYGPVQVTTQGLRLRGRNHYDFGQGDKTGVYQANGSNYSGALVSTYNYDTNQTFIIDPLTVDELKIDGNKTNNASATTIGFAALSWKCNLNVETANTSGDGIRVTDKNKAGTTISSPGGRAVEHYMHYLRAYNCGGTGIRIEDAGNDVTDWRIVADIGDCDGDGFLADRAAGADIQSVHVYTVNGMGVWLKQCWATNVARVYVEAFGLGGLSNNSGFNSGLRVEQLPGWPTSVTSGQIIMTTDAPNTAGVNYRLINIIGGSPVGGLNNPMVDLGNVQPYGVGYTTATEVGYYFTGSASGPIRIRSSQKLMNNGCGGGLGTISGTGVQTILPSTEAVYALTDGTTIATDVSQGSIFKVTLGGNRTISNPTNPVPGQEITYRLKQDATGSRTVTWGSKFRFGSTLPSPTLTTTAAKTDYLTFVYNLDDDKWDLVDFKAGF